MDGVREFVQPRKFYAYIIALYWWLWLVAHVSHDMLFIHAVRKYKNFPALVRNVGYHHQCRTVYAGFVSTTALARGHRCTCLREAPIPGKEFDCFGTRSRSRR
jgi:hypothetical protein